MSDVRQVGADVSAVNIRLLARRFHSVQPTNICVVALRRGGTSQHLLVASQRDCLDEASTVLRQNN